MDAEKGLEMNETGKDTALSDIIEDLTEEEIEELEKRRLPNCLRLDTFLPWRIGYAYIDLMNYKADRLFAENGVRVRWKKKHMRTPDGKFSIQFCTIPKKDEYRFLEVMEKLYDNIVICGEKEGYDEICALFEAITLKEVLIEDGLA